MSADREVWKPGKLWSLLDMLEIETKPFITAFGALNQMTMLIDQLIEAGRSGLDEIVTQPKRDLRRHLQDMATAAKALSATNTAGEAEFIRKQLADGITWRDLQPLLRGLNRSFRREIGASKVFALDKSKSANYALAAEVFGAEPVAAFPAAEFDLEEAGKCFALGRNTATVFHLMRAMEKIVLAAGRELDVIVIGKDEKDLEWGKVIANIGRAIENMPKGDLRTKWSNAHSLLYHVKEAWRNTTMHPNQKYTDDEAREILAAVKAFVRSLASLAPGGVFL